MTLSTDIIMHHHRRGVPPERYVIPAGTPVSVVKDTGKGYEVEAATGEFFAVRYEEVASR